MRTLVLAIVLTLPAVSPLAQAPEKKPEPTAAISGVVVDGTTGDLIENASVSLEGASAKSLQQTRQITDAKGRFVFANLPPAQDYFLSAAMTGYFNGGYTPGITVGEEGRRIPVKAGEWARDLTIKLWRPASITGRVVDERGEPVVAAFVRALRRAPIAGRDQLVNAGTAITDDRGVYRIGDLDSGRYVVEVPSVQGATPPAAGAATPAEFSGTAGAYPGVASRDADGRARAYPITFYPAARSISEAGSIEVQVPDQRVIGDLTLAPVPVFTVKGRIAGTTEGLTLRLLPAGLESLGNGSEAAQSAIGADGAFVFDNVPAGPYVITIGRRVSEIVSGLGRQNRSLPPPKGSLGSSYSVLGVTAAPPGLNLQQSQYGNNPRVSGRPVASPTTRMALNVSSDLSGVVVTLRAGAVMDATVVFDQMASTTTPKPSMGQVGLFLESATGDADLGVLNPTPQPAPPAGTAPDYRYHFDDIGAGEFWLRSRSTTWFIKSIEFGAQDYTTRPFDAAASSFTGVTVTLTDRAAAVSGVVKDKSAAVIVFPSDPSLWSNFGFNPSRIDTAIPDEAGRFSIGRLVAGDYCIIAVPREEKYAWLDPGYFARAAAFATRLTLGWGDRKDVSLSIARVPR